jgi:hypothetical protein
MKTRILLNKFRNNSSYYAFLLTSHFILYLLIIIIYFILFIYFFADPILCQGDETVGASDASGSTYLCEGESLEELKNIFNEETVKYNEALKELDDLTEKCNEAYQAKEYNKAFHYELKSEGLADDICEMFYKIKDIEENIKTLDKNFQSSIKEPDFL